MNELAINVEYLLLTRKCVIVPGLGSFTTRSFASQWLEEEDLFLPPVRHVRFNPDIFQDSDEVFLRSIMQIYNVSAEEAAKRCQQMVSEFHKALVIEGSVDFGSIGLFSLEDDAEIVMSPYECGVVSPEYYGLDALHFPLLANLPEEEKELTEDIVNVNSTSSNADEQKNNKPLTENINVVLPKPRTYVADSKHIIIRLNRAFVHYTMVTAACIALFFLLSPQNCKEDYVGTCQATTNVVLKTASDITKNNESIKKEKIVTTNVIDTLKEETDTLSNDVTNQPATEVKVVEKSIDDKVLVLNELRGNYSIVLASAISLKNAERFINRLQELEVNAIIYDNGKMLRVLVDGFATQSDAYNVNNYLHSLGNDFHSSWVMKN